MDQDSEFPVHFCSLTHSLSQLAVFIVTSIFCHVRDERDGTWVPHPYMALEHPCMQLTN